MAPWRNPRRLVVYALLVASLGVAAILGWGGDLLVAPDALPAHADAVVVLTGSLRGEEFRRAAALHLLAEGRADHLMLSASQVTFLGESVRS